MSSAEAILERSRSLIQHDRRPYEEEELDADTPTGRLHVKRRAEVG